MLGLDRVSHHREHRLLHHGLWDALLEGHDTWGHLRHGHLLWCAALLLLRQGRRREVHLWGVVGNEVKTRNTKTKKKVKLIGANASGTQTLAKKTYAFRV